MLGKPFFIEWPRILVLLVAGIGLSACTTGLQTKVSGNLNQLSRNQTVAILPVEVHNVKQQETAKLFRRDLYANLKQAHFNLLEHYIVDGQLLKHGMMEPVRFPKMDPMKFGEILGADAVVISRINRVEKSYLFLHSSIEISVSVQMVDTRTGEILWTAEQTESDYEGIAKIPTGMAAAVIAPIYLVTNKLKLVQLTSKMVNKLTDIVLRPDGVAKDKTFEETMIAAAWNQGEDINTKMVNWDQVGPAKPKTVAKTAAGTQESLIDRFPSILLNGNPETVSHSIKGTPKALKKNSPKMITLEQVADPSVWF
ncbi:MAG: GNA1162 family protein [Nitrospinaceae bacterium]